MFDSTSYTYRGKTNKRLYKILYLFVVDGIAIQRLFAGLWWGPTQSDESTGHNGGLQVQWG